jgi:hypothetical protein
MPNFLKNKQQHLATMHLHGLWLKCDCVEGGAFSFVKRNQLSYVLVNHPIEGKHHNRCPLHTNVSGEINDGEHEPKSSPKPPSSFTPLKLSEENKESTPSTAANENSKARKKSDRIHSLLTHALDEKHLNVIRPSKKINLNALYYSKMFSLPVTSHNKHIIKVSDITYILPNEKARDYQNVLQKIKYKFPDVVPLQSNFIFLVDDLMISSDNKTYIYTQGEQQKKISAIRQIHHYQRTSGPRIIFLIKAFIEGQWQNYLAYSHPIISIEDPILIDSNLEREFAKQYLSMAKPKSTLTKPYLSKEFQGSQLLPDFIYQDENSRCLIEVMGLMEQDEYKERKARLVPLMEKRFAMPVIEVTPDEISQKAIEIFTG